MSSTPRVRTLSVIVAGNLSAPLAVFVTAPILARALGPEARGELAGGSAPFMLLLALGAFGLPEATTTMVAKHRLSRSHTLRFVAACTALSGVFFSCGVWFASAYLSGGSRAIAEVITISAFALPPALLVGVLRAEAAGMEEWGRVTVEKIISSAFRVIGIVGLQGINRLTVWSAALVIMLAPISGALAYMRRSARSLDRGERHDLPTRRSIMSFAARAWVGSVAGILLSRLDQVLMVPLTGSAELGFYAVAVAVGDIPLILISAIGAMLLPADAAKQDDDLAQRAARLLLFVCLSGSILAIATIGAWLPFIFGPDFAPAAAPAIVLLLASSLGAAGSVAGSLLIARGAPGQRSLALVVAAGVNVVMLLVLVPAMGALGAAIATLVGSLLASSWTLGSVGRRYAIRPKDMVVVRLEDLRLLGTSARALAKRSRSPRKASRDVPADLKEEAS
jgi:O-antigen/teichoic acid export membrane protein